MQDCQKFGENQSTYKFNSGNPKGTCINNYQKISSRNIHTPNLQIFKQSQETTIRAKKRLTKFLASTQNPLGIPSKSSNSKQS